MGIRFLEHPVCYSISKLLRERLLLSPPMERSELEEIMRLVDLSIVVCVRPSVCLSVCLCTRIGGDMHSNERLLVNFGKVQFN